MFTETHKKNWAKQHSKLLCGTPNEQFESKMKLSLEKVSKITCTSMTITLTVYFIQMNFQVVALMAMASIEVCYNAILYSFLQSAYHLFWVCCWCTHAHVQHPSLFFNSCKVQWPKWKWSDS